MPAMVFQLTAPGPRPFLAMESDARQSGTCAPQARTVTPSRSADIPIVTQFGVPVGCPGDVSQRAFAT